MSSRSEKRPFSAGFSPSHLKAQFVQLCSRENLSAAFLALAIGCALTDPPIHGPLFFYYAIFLWAGYAFNRLQFTWNWTVFLVAVIGISALVAIPVSGFVPIRTVLVTSFLAMATLVLVPLLFLQTPIKKVFYALIPVWYLQAGIMAWQWFAEGAHRAAGLGYNANAGSAFLLLGAIFLMHDRQLKWLAVPLLIAIPFSGSRWVMIVGVVVLGLIFISKQVPWKWIAVGSVTAFIALFATQHSQLLEAYRVQAKETVQETVNGTIERNQEDIAYRLHLSTVLLSPSIFIPQGFIDSNIHNVPLRMAVETGLLSGLAWIGVCAISLYRKPRLGYAWWMMLAVGMLSLLYYHTWIGPLGAFWWLLAGELMRKSSNDSKAHQRGSGAFAEAFPRTY